MVKFRPARAVPKGERKMWREKDGKPVFWGMDECKPALPLVIVEGEMDALTLEEVGIPNAVSVPGGAEDLTCLDHCWDWLQQFKRIIIWPDNDKPGQEMCRKLIHRLGAWRCSVVQAETKDANELLALRGKDAVRDAVMQATEVPISGLIRLADVEAFDHDSLVRVRSSVRAINQVIGGYMVGQVSIWTGNAGAGKSTFLGQELLTAVDQGYKVCAYSGELPGAIFRYWIDLQAAGPQYLEARADALRGIVDGRPAEVFYPRAEMIGRIRNWYRDKFFLHDAFGCTTDEALLEVFTYAARRYNCKVFLIDNLMTTAFGGSERDFYRKQSEFVGRMVDFAHEHDVHVHLVAHPRKTEGSRLSRLDVSGSADITNRADNVFSMWRPPLEERAPDDADCTVTILKNRFSGRQDEALLLKFDPDSRRFCMKTETAHWQYGWLTAEDEPQGWNAMGREVVDHEPLF
jgi:twinkle protein